jgi:hypothetical protein
MRSKQDFARHWRCVSGRGGNDSVYGAIQRAQIPKLKSQIPNKSQAPNFKPENSNNAGTSAKHQIPNKARANLKSQNTNHKQYLKLNFQIPKWMPIIERCRFVVSDRSDSRLRTGH